MVTPYATYRFQSSNFLRLFARSAPVNIVVVVLVIVLVGLGVFRIWWESDTQVTKRMIRKLKASK